MSIRLPNTIKWYNENAQKFADAIEKYTDSDQIIPFSQLLPPHALILDAGCGTGRDTSLLKGHGFVPVGLDLSIGMLTLARQKYPGIEFIEGNLLHLPFEASTFDGVWAHASLLHLKDAATVIRAIKEFNRVLKKDGILHIFLRAKNGNRKDTKIPSIQSGFKRWFQKYTKPQVLAMLEKASLANIFTEQYTEVSRHPNGGRPDVVWIHSLSKKV